jgi:outer membrane biogenesis lipoprotein LolB
LPTDPGAPLADFAQVHTQLSAACSGVRTLTAELALSGRAGDQRLRGRIVAGFERPASMRLEAVAPIGQPIFILAARANSATLLFPRDARMLRDANPQAILEALTGVNLAPADLQAILTGCVVAAPRAIAGRLHANGWASIDLASTASPGGAKGAPEATIYLQRQGNQWQVRAARREGWTIDYSAWAGQFPRSVRLESQSPTVRVDLTTNISQLETNVDIDAAAFTVDEPRDARPLTLEELREAGPLRGN